MVHDRMLKWSRALALSLFVPLLLHTAVARAGIVNVQSALVTEASPGLSGSVTASLQWRTGNSKLLLMGISPVARFRAGNHLVVAILRGDYGRSGDADIVKKAFEHLRYRYSFHPRMLGEMFQQAEYDKFRLLELRTLVGAGPKFDLVSDKRLLISFGIAYMMEYEKPSSDALETESEIFHRASSYLTGRFELDEKVQIVETVYAQPCLTDFNDYKLLNDSQLVVHLNKTVSLTTSLSLAYDAKPLHLADGTQLEKLDTTTKTSITVSF